ncbi:MAG: hypothetical protein IJ658_08525 [Kiritimatiellae bacterium]|nr:hypothetical protein [Kiritimatiellia bacterium]
MNRLHLLTAGCLAAFVAVADGPTDNLRATWRNPVHTPSASGGVSQNAVMIGAGSGRHFTTNHYYYSVTGGYWYPTTVGMLENYLRNYMRVSNLRSTLGAPIAAASANKFLGEPLDAPANWDGRAPVITSGTGGRAVWIDFAKKVITTQAGPIEVKWGLTGGGTNVENSVVAASPTKRPVRLYWTHERPSYISEQTAMRPLQNAGPTVQFGSNYKVHLYGTDTIKVLTGLDGTYVETDGTTGWYSQGDGKGYVRLNGGELQAFEGSYGTFLIVYSRLDEALNERVMLAYEIVDVLEPTQTQIDVGIGDQLRPLTRSFNTNELFPWVTRGLTDDSDNDEIYVYQHGSGAQKNYLWAIRDSSANPWKIEVFWRAKEELDVVWPFEVDIYAASWKDVNAQRYLRNGAGHTGGEVSAEPKVFVPGSVSVEAMDYQVPRRHVHVENGAFYTDYADGATYALLKYTAGDTVWFQTVKSVMSANVGAESAFLAREIEPDGEFRWEGASDGFFYPGWIRHDFATNDPDRWPVPNAYNPGFYRYPTAWAPTNSLYAPIFPVNIGQLEVWWSKVANINGAVREGSGHVEALSTPIFFPTAACRYDIYPPDENVYWNTATPQIVLASGKGSAGWTLADQETETYAPVVRIKIREPAGYVDGVFVANVPGGFAGDAFTVENWIAFPYECYYPLETTPYPSGPVQWLAFH